MRLFISLILTLGFVSPCNSQINQELLEIAQDLQIDKDTSTPGFFFRNRDYSFKIENDSLLIAITINDSYDLPGTPRNDTLTTQLAYKLRLGDIADIEVDDSNLADQHLFISAQRLYPLFKQTKNNGIPLNTDGVKIQILRDKDIVHFEQLKSVLYQYANIEDNYIASNCDYDKIPVGKGGNVIQAIESYALEEPIKLNGQTDLNKELKSILSKYLRKQDIKKLYGTVVINSAGDFEYFDSFQNEMYNKNLKSETLRIGEEIVADKAHYRITDKQLQRVTKILRRQAWEAGACNKVRTNCYFEFLIEHSY